VGTEGVLVHNACEIVDIVNEISSTTVAGNYFHNLPSVDDIHRMSARSFGGINENDFANAISAKNWTLLENMGFQVEVFDARKGFVGISKGDKRYRTPIVKRAGELQGNIEIKPSRITWADVNNKMPSSPRFENSKDIVINHHIKVNTQ
jgi:hypothetical protein